MALQEYIVVSDITNKSFTPFLEDTRQTYVDMANDFLEDMGRTRGIIAEDIAMPIHSVLKRHIINYALSVFAEDMIDTGADGSRTQTEDKYETLFKRTRYLMQESKLDIVDVMFTGDAETKENRAVESVRLYRG